MIISELLGITLAGVLGASLPQEGTARQAEVEHLRSHGGLVRAAVDRLGLDHVFRTGWFLLLSLLIAVSLSIVIVDQLRKLRVLWDERLVVASFRSAPFRTEFERPARLPAEAGRAIASSFRTSGRIGLAGPPVFHTGILLVILAGALRALFAVNAATDLVEGDTLPATDAAWGGQWPGLLGRPFRLPYPVRFDSLSESRYPHGELKDLAVDLTLLHAGGERSASLAINRELPVPSGRLYLGSDFGPALLVEWRTEGRLTREAVLLSSRGKGVYGGSTQSPAGLTAQLRSSLPAGGGRPQTVEVRAVRGPALLFAGLVDAGRSVQLPDGEEMTIQGIPYWARLRGSRDLALPLVYVGFGLITLGAILMFTVVKVDTCVVVRPLGETERVSIALKAQRLEPLFAERFERLARNEGGMLS